MLPKVSFFCIRHSYMLTVTQFYFFLCIYIFKHFLIVHTPRLVPAWYICENYNHINRSTPVLRAAQTKNTTSKKFVNGNKNTSSQKVFLFWTLHIQFQELYNSRYRVNPYLCFLNWHLFLCFSNFSLLFTQETFYFQVR